MLQRYLLVWLFALSLVAFFWPTWFAGGFDPFIASKPFLVQLFAVTMFAVGALLPQEEIRQVFKKWPTVLGGTAVQYTAMPLFAFVLANLFNLDADTKLGVILVGCVPGAMASNVLTLTARANVSYSVSLTTSATLFSPLIVPLVLYVAVNQTGMDRAAIAQDAFKLLIFQVVGPVIFGHLLSRTIKQFETFMSQWGPVFANLSILWIIAVVVNINHEKLQSAGLLLVGILVLINFLGYIAGFSAGSAMKLPDGMRRALTLEVGMQNAGMGAVMAGQLFPDSAAIALPPALYMFGCMMTGTLLAQFWSKKTLAAAAQKCDAQKEKPDADPASD